MSDQLPHIGGDFWRGWPQRITLNADAVDQKTPFSMEAGPTSASASAVASASASTSASANSIENWPSTAWSTSATWSLPEPLPRPSAGVLASPSASWPSARPSRAWPPAPSCQSESPWGSRSAIKRGFFAAGHH